MEILDYSKYLSIDNGCGLLLNSNVIYVLDSYGIRYDGVTSYSDLIFNISKYIDDNCDSEIEDLEEVLDIIKELHYYSETRKQGY